MKGNTYLSIVLFILSVIIAGLLLFQKNPWLVITFYWLVTVIKNADTRN